MILGVGSDLIDIRRIEAAIARFGDRFIDRIFTEAERRRCERRANPGPSYARRFAAKEAAFKAMERGWMGDISWKEIEVYNEPSGAPRIVFYGKALELIKEKKVVRAFVTISHIEEHATAVVVLETE